MCVVDLDVCRHVPSNWGELRRVFIGCTLLKKSSVWIIRFRKNIKTQSSASNMPGEYTESVFSGQAVAGVISRLAYHQKVWLTWRIFSIINIISIAVTKNQEQAAVCFFFLAAGITVLVMISFHRLRQNEYFKQCQRQPFEMEVSL